MGYFYTVQGLGVSFFKIFYKIILFAYYKGTTFVVLAQKRPI